MNDSNKSCSRCKEDISCKADDIANCDCAKIVLNEETTRFLAKTNYDCLCNTCLEHLQDLVKLTNEIPQKMIPKIHYYIENGNYVFTEFYHIQRGYCCGSGCRHCGYGN